MGVICSCTGWVLSEKGYAHELEQKCSRVRLELKCSWNSAHLCRIGASSAGPPGNPKAPYTQDTHTVTHTHVHAHTHTHAHTHAHSFLSFGPQVIPILRELVPSLKHIFGCSVSVCVHVCVCVCACVCVLGTGLCYILHKWLGKSLKC
jgi:hypothetical protein